jgi:hypothetical protein
MSLKSISQFGITAIRRPLNPFVRASPVTTALAACTTSLPLSQCRATCSQRPFSTSKMAKDENQVRAKQTGEKEDSHQYQAGSRTDRKEDEWKHREPYAIHDTEKNGKFDVKWEGSCHCGKVTYQLSREKPLAAKYCHCTTCQRLHGVSDISLSVCIRAINHVASPRSNGPRFSIRATLTSPRVTTIWDGMTQQRNPLLTTFPAKSRAPTVAPPSWTRVGI